MGASLTKAFELTSASKNKGKTLQLSPLNEQLLNEIASVSLKSKTKLTFCYFLYIIFITPNTSKLFTYKFCLLIIIFLLPVNINFIS